MSGLLTINEATQWASQYLRRNIQHSNISYLLQYGRIHKHSQNGKLFIDKEELQAYYDSQTYDTIDDTINWKLSFSEYREAERTKHVHRLHPYKGKFIPQLVEYFLDSHTDTFKQQVYFQPGDIVLDPFCGSGTTLVQANELSLHAVGIDISLFNTMISNIKVRKHNLPVIQQAIQSLTNILTQFELTKRSIQFEQELTERLALFNTQYFPPAYKRWVRNGSVQERQYASEKVQLFLPEYHKLLSKHDIKLVQETNHSFIDTWFLFPVRKEIDKLASAVDTIPDADVKEVLSLILSRAMRSCRATTHADLGTLKEPVHAVYYCKKHGKICKPVFSIRNWWQRYCKDTIKRLATFDTKRTQTEQLCLTGDSMSIDIAAALRTQHNVLGDSLCRQKARGIFSSPPYVGLIDYHEQHAYAYDLFQLERRDEQEIAPLYKGQGKKAQEGYVTSVANVLKNCEPYLQENWNIFIVANDKYSLYPRIVQQAGMKIVQTFHRPVLNRVEKDRSNLYSETIFHIQKH